MPQITNILNGKRYRIVRAPPEWGDVTGTVLKDPKSGERIVVHSKTGESHQAAVRRVALKHHIRGY